MNKLSVCTDLDQKNKTTEKIVEKRVKEIKEDKDINFHYIPTTENHANMASRGTSILEPKENILWWHGSEWTTTSRYDCPMQKCDYSEEKKEEIRKQTEEEFRQAKVMFEAKLIAGKAPPVDKLVDEAPFDLYPNKYSSLKNCGVLQH